MQGASVNTHGTIFVNSGMNIASFPQLISKGCGHCGGPLRFHSDTTEYYCLTCGWACYIETKQDKMVEDVMKIAKNVRDGKLSYELGKVLYDLSMQNEHELVVIK